MGLISKIFTTIRTNKTTKNSVENFPREKTTIFLGRILFPNQTEGRNNAASRVLNIVVTVITIGLIQG